MMKFQNEEEYDNYLMKLEDDEMIFVIENTTYLDDGVIVLYIHSN